MSYLVIYEEERLVPGAKRMFDGSLAQMRGLSICPAKTLKDAVCLQSHYGGWIVKAVDYELQVTEQEGA